MGAAGHDGEPVTNLAHEVTRVRAILPSRLRGLDKNTAALLVTVGAGWASRIVAAFAQLAMIRVLTETLGIGGYGAFAVLTGLLGWFALADLGFGSSLQNFISQNRVEGKTSVDAIASVATVLAGAMLCLTGLWFGIAGWAGPFLLSASQDISPQTAATGFLVFAVIATGTGASAIALRICFAEHRGYLAHLVSALSVLMSLALLLLVLPRLSADDRFVWSLALFAGPTWILPTLLLIGYLLRHRARGHSLHLNFADVRRIWGRARIFLLYNAMAALVLNVDYIILSQTVSTPDIAEYAIFSRVYALAFFIFGSVLSAYWPLCAEMLHRGETQFVRKMIARSILFGTAVILGATGMLWLFAEPIAQVLAPSGNLVLSLGLIPLFAGYWIVRIWCDTFAMVVHSANRTMVLLIVGPVQAAMNIAFGWYGAQQGGLAGLLVGMTASFILTVGWFLPVYMSRVVLRGAGALRQ